MTLKGHCLIDADIKESQLKALTKKNYNCLQKWEQNGVSGFPGGRSTLQEVNGSVSFTVIFFI